MNRGILQTALNNKTLGLELEYRVPSTQGENELAFTKQLPRFHRPTSEEFVELLSAI